MIRLFRTYEKGYTKGRLETPFGTFFTLERKENNNISLPLAKQMGMDNAVSCIPEGVYDVEKSQFWGGKRKGKRAFRLQNVPNRSGILIHIGNYVKDSDGCILVGTSFNDNVPMVVSSTIAFNKLWDNLPNKFQLEITRDNTGDFAFWKDYEHLERVANAPSVEAPKKPQKSKKKGVKSGLFMLIVLFIVKMLR